MGVAADFCVFVEEDFDVRESDAEGRVAVGGDFYANCQWANNYTIGAGDYNTYAPYDVLIDDRKGAATFIVGGEMYGQLNDTYYDWFDSVPDPDDGSYPNAANNSANQSKVYSAYYSSEYRRNGSPLINLPVVDSRFRRKYEAFEKNSSDVKGKNDNDNNVTDWYRDMHGNVTLTPTRKSDKKIVINQDKNDASLYMEHYTGTNTIPEHDGFHKYETITDCIPESSYRQNWQKMDQTQTYVAEIIDFNETFRKLEKTSEKMKKRAERVDEGQYNFDENTSTFTFAYSGDPTQKRECVFFNLTANDYVKFRSAEYVKFENIPELPEPRTVVNNDGSDYEWRYSYIVVNVGETGTVFTTTDKHAPGNTYSSGDKTTYINGVNIYSDATGLNDDYRSNHPGVSSLLYNFYAASEVVLGKNFQGTIFAPNAKVTDQATKYNEISYRGHLSGALIAKSFTGATEFGYRPFNGEAAILDDGVDYGVKVSKVDTAGNLLAGATISLYKAVEKLDENGDPTGEYVKDGDPVISKVSTDEAALVFDGLEAGKYIICEDEAPAGYSKDTKEHYFEIEKGKDISIGRVGVNEFYNAPVIYLSGDHTTVGTVSPQNYDGVRYNRYFPTTPRDTLNFAEGDKMRITSITSGSSVYVRSVTFYYENPDFVANGGPLYLTETVNVNQSFDTASDLFTIADVLPADIIDRIVKISVSSQCSSASSTSVKRATFEWTSVRNWRTRYITQKYDYYYYYSYYSTLLAQTSVPLKYYRKAADDTEYTYNIDGVDVVAERKEVTQDFYSKEGKLTVYKDNTFSSRIGRYNANPLTIENNIYVIDGQEYTFDVDFDDDDNLIYTICDADGNAIEDQDTFESDHNIVLKCPKNYDSSSQYIVCADGEIVYPKIILSEKYNENGFEIVNQKDILISKKNALGAELSGAVFTLTADEVESLDSVTGEEDAINVKIYDDKTETTAKLYKGCDPIEVKGGYYISGLPDGTYILKEKLPPTGYAASEAEFTITVKSGDVTEVNQFPAPEKEKGPDFELDKDKNEVIIFDEMAIDEIEIVKNWNDLDNALGARPEKLEITVTGTAEGAPKVEKTVELNEENSWSVKIKLTEADVANDSGEYDTLPLYYYPADGERVQYTYSYVEPEDIEAYELEENNPVIGEDATVTFNNGLAELGSLSVTKTWVDCEDFVIDDAARPDVMFTLVDTVSGEIYNESKSMSNDAENGVITFENIPLYTYTKGDNGLVRTAVQYLLTETDVTGYTSDASSREIILTEEETWNEDEMTASVEVTNTYETTEISIRKFWKVQNNQWASEELEERPASIEVEVVGIVDEEVVYTRPETVIIEPDANDVWTASVDGLPKYYYANGVETEIQYSVSRELDMSPKYTFEAVTDGNTITVTNTYTQTSTEIELKKIWDDNGYTAIRPVSVSFEIIGTVGTDDNEQAVYPAEKDYHHIVALSDNGSDEWTLAVENLPKYYYYDDAEGETVQEEISYKVIETAVPDGYTKSEDGLTVTNTLSEEIGSLNVTKVWEDDVNEGSKRPDSVTIRVTGTVDGVPEATVVKDVVLTSDAWSKEFTLSSNDIYTEDGAYGDVLPMYYYVYGADGESAERIEFTYVVSEPEVPEGYISEVDGTTVTNTYVEESSSSEIEESSSSKVEESSSSKVEESSSSKVEESSSSEIEESSSSKVEESSSSEVEESSSSQADETSEDKSDNSDSISADGDSSGEASSKPDDSNSVATGEDSSDNTPSMSDDSNSIITDVTSSSQAEDSDSNNSDQSDSSESNSSSESDSSSSGSSESDSSSSGSSDASRSSSSKANSATPAGNSNPNTGNGAVIPTAMIAIAAVMVVLRKKNEE